MAVASSSSASVAVEKATSEFLIGPDWTMNIDICDSLNSNGWLAKDVVKAVKKRLQHKNPKVQLLALTLLETMVKNCGDYIHFQIAEKNILGEMVRIVKKKTDMHVRDKILVLLDSWQEAFGGPGGKHPHYYWAYEELRRSGVVFPRRSMDAAPIFTPPVAQSTLRHAHAGNGMPSDSSRRLDETMAAEIEGLSLSSLDSMRNVMDLLDDMLQAVNHNDHEAVKDEIIIDLVNRCRSNQKKLMQMLTTTGDEELLGRGLELNDSLQILLAKHDAIASGHPLPTQVTKLSPKPSGGSSSSAKEAEAKQARIKDSGSSPGSNATATIASATRSHIDDEDEEEDEFALLARRHSKPQSSQSQTCATSDGAVPSDTNNVISSMSTSTASTSSPSDAFALAVVDPAAPFATSKDQDMIDLLTLTLSAASTSDQPQTPHSSQASVQNMPQPVASNQSMSKQGYPYGSHTYPGNEGQAAYNSYVVPWAQAQPQQQLQFPPQPHLQPQVQQQHVPSESQLQPQTVSQSHQHLQPQQQFVSPSQQRQYPQQQFASPSQPQQYQAEPQQQFSSHSQPQSYSHPQHQQQFPLQLEQSYPQPQQPYPQSQPGQQFQTQPPEQTYSQPQAGAQLQTRSEQLHIQRQPKPQSVHQQLLRPQHQQQYQPQQQSQYPTYSSGYPPPPWAATPGYAIGQTHTPTTSSSTFSTAQSSAALSYAPAQAARPMQHSNSFTSRGSNAMKDNPWVSSGTANTGSTSQKPFIPSYRLFEDLNVLGNADERFKISGSTSNSLSGPSNQGMVGRRK